MDSKLYHVTNGGVFCAPTALQNDREGYKKYIRDAYGSLRGVVIVKAKNRQEAGFIAATVDRH